MYKTSFINLSRVTFTFPLVIVDGHIISPTNSLKNLSFIFISTLLEKIVFQLVLTFRKFFFYNIENTLFKNQFSIY